MSGHSRDLLAKLLFGTILLAAPHAAAAVSGESVLYAFKGGIDGNNPEGGLVADRAGNLYGTTVAGGSFNAGTIFKLAPDGTQSVLYSFMGGSAGDGANPEAALVLDAAGNLYGTTVNGGSDQDFGTVFKLTPDGTETVLYRFAGPGDGATPFAGLIENRDGNLFGTTSEGGAGAGTVFKIAPDGTQTVLHSFTGPDGANPMGKLIEDKKGNFYGTAPNGGSSGANCQLGCGVVFKLKANGTETVIHAFDSTDGRNPFGGLIEDKSGNLYGTTVAGGSADRGTVFEIAADGTFSVLYNFNGDTDGNVPRGELLMDNVGNLYGLTIQGGTHNHGALFKIAPDGTETVLCSFNKTHGADPVGALIADKHFHHLYGAALSGGPPSSGTVTGYGVVFDYKQ
jgi:uncharacterized repeat protein (TIGR03803 family)